MRYQYNIKDVTVDHINNTIKTNDGLFESYQDKQGYSYWYDNTLKLTLGRHAYDYFFLVSKGYVFEHVAANIRHTYTDVINESISLLNRLKDA